MTRAYKILLLIIIPEIIAQDTEDNQQIELNLEYCNLRTCRYLIRTQHTMCFYQSDQPGDGCKDVRVLSNGLTESEKTLIVKRHNDLRQYVAAGNETRGNPGPQPRAAFMPNLTWDEELAQIAQRWANQCNNNWGTHDKCRDVERFRVEQNVAVGSSNEHLGISDVSYLINVWYNEVEDFNNSRVRNYKKNPREPGRAADYEQMVWAETTKIGCGKIIFSEVAAYNTVKFVCNYGPAGCIENQTVYRTL